MKELVQLNVNLVLSVLFRALLFLPREPVEALSIHLLWNLCSAPFSFALQHFLKTEGQFKGKTDTMVYGGLWWLMVAYLFIASQLHKATFPHSATGMNAYMVIVILS